MNNYERMNKIYKYLREETDEDHQLTTNELLSELKNELNVYIDRKTLSKNLRLLEDYDVDVIINRNSQNNIYIGEREFSLEEIKLLIDAVESSKLITLNKTKTLVNKLLSFLSIHQAEQIIKNNYFTNEIKPQNEKVYLIMNKINEAINRNKQIIFQYGEYDSNKCFVPKYDGRYYKLSPYKLMWNNDHYYLIGYNEKYNNLNKYRVDRIYSEVSIDESSDCIKVDNINVNEFIKQTFNMFDGNQKEVELLCQNEMMNYIIDKFGVDVETRIVDDKQFTATILVNVSPTFYSWVFGFDGKIIIKSPECVKFNYINSIITQYNIYTKQNYGA